MSGVVAKLRQVALVIVGTAVALFGLLGVLMATSTSTGQDCPGSAIGNLLHAVTGVSETMAADCRTQAGYQVGGGAFFLLLGLLGVCAPWISKEARLLGSRNVADERAAGLWRFAPVTRAFVWLVIALPSAVCLVALVLTRTDGWLIGLVFASLYAAFIHRMAVHPSVRITHDEVVVANVFSTRRVALKDIVSVGSPGYMGLLICLRDGSNVSVWIGQKTNIAAARGKRTNADELADDLAAHVAGERHLTSDQVAATGAQRASAKKEARVALIFGTAWIVVLILVEFFVHR